MLVHPTQELSGNFSSFPAGVRYLFRVSDGDAPRVVDAAQQAVPAQPHVEPQLARADGQFGGDQIIGDVVDKRSDIAQVIVEPLHLEQQPSPAGGRIRQRCIHQAFYRLAVSQRMGEGRIAGNEFGQSLSGRQRVAGLEELLNPAMLVAQVDAEILN